MQRNAVALAALAAALVASALAAQHSAFSQERVKPRYYQIPGGPRVTLIEADNGAVFGFYMEQKLDPAGAWALVCQWDHPHCLDTLTTIFDCSGHYCLSGRDGRSCVTQIAPPRSIIGQIAEIVCKTTGAKPGHMY